MSQIAQITDLRKYSRGKAWSAATAAGLIAAWFFSAHVTSRGNSLLGSEFHVDGAFQTFASVARICAGQYPGGDFDLYLGHGPIGLTALLSWAMGCQLGESIYAAHLLTLCALYGLVLILSFAFFRILFPNGLGFVAAIAATVLLRFVHLSIDLDSNNFAPIQAFSELAAPGNSLLMLRYASILILSTLILITPTHSRISAPVIGGAIGPALFWSFDTGIPAAIALTAIFAIRLYNGPADHRPTSTAMFAVCAMISVILSLLVTSGGNPSSYISFRSGVAETQYWYFGPYTDARYFEWGKLFRYFNDRGDEWISFTLLIYPFLIIVLAYLSARSRFFQVLFIISVVSFLGGAISEYGGHISSRYYSVAILIFPLIIISSLANICRRWVPVGKIGESMILPIGIAVGIATIMASTLKEKGYFQIAISDSREFVRELGTTIVRQAQPDIMIANQIAQSGQSWLSTYFNLADALLGIHRITRVDSLIHAYGPEKTRWENLLRDRIPDVVLTTRPAYSDWQNWLVQSNWPFFRNLVQYYSPTTEGYSLISWSRNVDGPATTRSRSCTSSQRSPSDVEITVQSSDADPTGPELLDVKVWLEVDLVESLLPINGKRKILILHNGDEYGPGSLVGLDPQSKVVSFPIAMLFGVATRSMSVAPASRAKLKVIRCEAQSLGVPDSVVKSLFSLKDTPTPFNLIDENWQNGVAKHWAGFFVLATPRNRETLVPGTSVLLRGSGRRRIIDVRDNGPYLNIYVDGALLDPKKDGSPNPFLVE